MSGFWDDVGDFGKSLFTGRWTGGQDSVGDIWNRDPMAIIAPVGAIAGGAALGAGALGGLGAAEAAGGVGAAEAGTFADVGIAEVGGAYTPLAGSTLSAAEGSAFGSPEFMTAFGAETGGAEGGAAAGNLEGAFSPGGGPSWLPGAQATPATVPPGGGGDSFFGKLGGDIMNHPLQALGVGAAGIGLGSALLRGNQDPQAQKNVGYQADTLRGQTQELMATGKQLESYLLNGNLPPGQQAQVKQAVKAARAAAIANAAKNGQNTNPRMNTQLEQALMDIDMNGLMLASKLETALFDKGTAMVNTALDATKLSTQMYQWLTAQDKATQQQVTQALAVFAGTAAGGRGGVNLNLGGTKAA